ncbi:MAG TPA: hypothetical protein GXX18_11460 [Bacillales bacterium]|nr:hypothetical protein [Bacillales bacterium]
MMNNKMKFNVFWSKDAELALIKHKQFINVKLAYKNSLTMLSVNPHNQKEGVIDCGSEFDGYYWVNINNVIIFYRVDDDLKKVFIDGCSSALTGEALRMYYGEYDPWLDDE